MSLIFSLLIFLIVWAIIFAVLYRFVPDIVGAIGLPGYVTQLIIALAAIMFIWGLLGFVPGAGTYSYYHYGVTP